MRDKRRIRIKNHLLRKVRYNLRIIIGSAVSNKLIQILKTVGETSKEFQDLYWAHYHSIFTCAFGGACETHIEALNKGLDSEKLLADTDMVYDASFKQWVCEKCYELRYKNNDILSSNLNI